MFEKLHNIKSSHSVFSATTFFQFTSTKTALQILLQYAWDFENNLTTLYAQLISDDNQKSYNVRKWVLTYSAHLKLCTDEFADCKSQINQLTTKANWILTTLDQTKDTNPKHNKRGVIHSIFNFLFGDTNGSADIEAIKDNMTMLQENQDALINRI